MHYQRVVVVLAVLAAAPAAAAAQARAEPPALQQSAAVAPALAPDPRLGSVDAAEPVAAEPAAAAPAARSRAASTGRRVLATLGGAVVGAWAGYMGSQVTRSDWEKDSNSEFSSYRMRFAAGGAVFGAFTGFLLGDSRSSSRPPRLLSQPGTERNLITLQEIQGLVGRAQNAMDLIQSLRPQWLQVRGVASSRETGRAEVVGRDQVVVTDPGQATIKVYLDNALLGSVDALRQVPIASIREARFLDPAAATYRWGAGHLHGAILISFAENTQ
ncbi:MAG TPA: hypothetical protein VEW03_14245 [Longimicrobiaceae bacterium]|nr:hypothetical protein [Longimicrobiaceae bacterium]